MKRVICLLLTACCISFSCSKQDRDLSVEIRVHNATTYQIEKLAINTTGGEIIFNALGTQFTTGYRTVTNMLPNTSYTIKIQGQQEQKVFVEDDVIAIYNGYYTYKIVNDAHAQLAIQRIKD